MKKIISILIIGIIVLSGFAVNALKNKSNNINQISEDFTHKVLLEIGNTQFCGGCDFWNKDVYDLYSTGDYDFEYVNMIVYGPDGFNDILNLEAFDWNNLYNISKYPTTILDGNFRKLQYQPYTLPFTIEECGIRDVRKISAIISLQWLGNATIEINISIENNEDIPYNGYIRVAITEITSRYNTVNNSKFNFGFLDYAFNKEIFISDRGIYTDSVTWNGNDHEDNHGENFEDIIPGNIQVVMGVYNNQNGYVDQTTKGFINSPPTSPEIDGPASGKVGEEFDFTFVSEAPDNIPLCYYINWGDESFNDWFGPFDSGEIVKVSHNWSTKGRYTIKARAKTINGLMGPWGELEIKIPKTKSFIYTPLYNLLKKFPIFEVFLRLINH